MLQVVSSFHKGSNKLLQSQSADLKPPTVEEITDQPQCSEQPRKKVLLELSYFSIKTQYYGARTQGLQRLFYNDTSPLSIQSG